MATPSDAQTRANIRTIIQDGLTALYGTATVPRVHGRWILSLDIGQNAAALRALSGSTMGKIHGYMISSSTNLRQRPDLKDGFNTQSLQKKGPTRRDIVKGYRVWVFRQLEEGTESVNSENDFIAELEFIADFVDKEPTLRFTDIEVRGHRSLNFPVIDTYPFGDTVTHLAQGILEVVLHRHLI